MNVKKEYGASITYEDPGMTTDSQSLNTNDIIDLIEISDCEDTSDVSIIVSDNSLHLQQLVRPPIIRVQTSTNSSENEPCNAQSESMDDSICILFEKIQPAPEVVVINEIIVDNRGLNQSTDTVIDGRGQNQSTYTVIDGRGQNQSTYTVIDGRGQNQSNDTVIEGRGQNQSTDTVIDGREQNQSGNESSASIPVSPIIMGSYNDEPILSQETSTAFGADFRQIHQLFPEIVNGISYSPINLSPIHNAHVDYDIADSQPTSRPSCKYALRSCSVRQQPEFFRCPLVTNQVSLDLAELKTVKPQDASGQGSELKNSNVEIKVPKIQCGICLDGPDEIATSGRNFTSTNCGHVFCNTCIKTSMKNAAKCPKCRKKITSKSIHPLYL